MTAALHEEYAAIVRIISRVLLVGLSVSLGALIGGAGGKSGTADGNGNAGGNSNGNGSYSGLEQSSSGTSSERENILVLARRYMDRGEYERAMDLSPNDVSE